LHPSASACASAPPAWRLRSAPSAPPPTRASGPQIRWRRWRAIAARAPRTSAAARLGAATAALDAGLEAAHRHDRFLRRGARYTWRAIALLGLLAGFAMLRA
jgi:hypothetical protein